MAGFLTNSGLAKLAVATPLTPMTVKYMAFDSGQGTPTPTMPVLFNEVYRTEIPNPVKDPSNPKNLTFSGFVPTTVGGWTVYGVGLFDSLNVLVAYLQLEDPIVKSDPISPLKMSWTQDFIIALANAGETDLIVTDSIEFRHDALTNRNHTDAHNIASITGLQDNLSAKDTRMTGIDTTISGLQTDVNNKDEQNVKLTGDQTIDGYKSFNGNIGVETINNGNATISLENDSAGISAGTGPNFTGISIDASGKTVNVTGQLVGDGSGLDAATTTKKGAIQLATSAEVTAGSNAVKGITPATLRSGLGATGSAPVFAARAWVNFNGATGAIRAGGNVASVVRNSVGNYTINFTTAMPIADYAPQTAMSSFGAGAGFGIVSQTAGSITLQATYGGDNTIGVFDPAICSLTVFC